MELGLKGFYLDDGILAGGQESVAAAKIFLDWKFSDTGLSLNRSKCELVPMAGKIHRVDPALLQGFEFTASGSSGSP